MTEAFAAYHRGGGRPPSDDESLEIRADGSWRLWRTVAGARVGAFTGRLSPDRARRLATAVDEARAAPPPTDVRRRPDSAAEAFRAGAAEISTPAAAPVRGGWSRLVHLLRKWSDDLTSEPEAALALELDTQGGARLTRIGPGILGVYPDTVAVRWYVRSREDVPIDQARNGADAGVSRGEVVATGAGWSLPLAPPRPLPVPDGGSLEAWVTLAIAGPHAPVMARLYASRAG
jgi:hypothetical protein